MQSSGAREVAGLTQANRTGHLQKETLILNASTAIAMDISLEIVDQDVDQDLDLMNATEGATQVLDLHLEEEIEGVIIEMTEEDHQTAIVIAVITMTAEIDTTVIVEDTHAPDHHETIEDEIVTLAEVRVQSNLGRMTRDLEAEVLRKIEGEEEEIRLEVEVLIMLKTIGRDQPQKSKVSNQINLKCVF